MMQQKYINKLRLKRYCFLLSAPIEIIIRKLTLKYKTLTNFKAKYGGTGSIKKQEITTDCIRLGESFSNWKDNLHLFRYISACIRDECII